MSIQITSIGMCSGAHPAGNAAHFRGAHIAVARLLEAQCPLRRERRLAAEVRVALDHALQRWAVDQVIVDRPVRGAEGEDLRVLPAKIEPAAPGIIEQDAEPPAAPPVATKKGMLL